MKKLNRTRIMKRAWWIFKNGDRQGFTYATFSDALKKSWNEYLTFREEERKEAEYEKERLEEAKKPRQNTVCDMSGAAEWYANARPGQYMGD